MTIAHRQLRVGVVVGTRPEAIKLAPLIRELRTTARLRPVVISTGQHRAMVEELLAGFDIAPDVDLQLAGGSLADLAGRATIELGRVIRDERLGAVVVQGDTTTALAGALAGFSERAPVIHLEAGLRTYDRFSPFPEEVNRRVITQLSDLHLAPSADAAERLRGERVPSEAIAMTGNTVVDALLETVRRGAPFVDPRLARLPEGCRLMLVTAHRRESWGAGIRSIAEAVAEILDTHRELVAVMPVHPNPAVRATVMDVLAGVPRAIVTDPLPYADMVGVLNRAALVVTDSGGIQEEACTLGTPTLVTRTTTERPEGIAAGGLLLVGTDRLRIVTEATRLLRDPAAYDALVCRTSPFGDGLAAERATAAIEGFLEARGLLAEASADLAPAREAVHV